MYSGNVMMTTFLHEPCSSRKGPAHVPFSATRRAAPDNDGMAKDDIGSEMGRRIAEARKARGWTQKELAEQTGWSESAADDGSAAGFSPSRIGNYEQGERRVSNEEAEVFAQVFGLHPAYFLAAISEQEARVLSAMRDAYPTRIQGAR